MACCRPNCPPTPGNGLLHRPEQLEKVDKILERKLLLISAPAGFGKTTLVSEWIERQLARYESGRFSHHGLIEKKSGKLIGQCG